MYVTVVQQQHNFKSARIQCVHIDKLTLSLRWLE